jgi:hypothetical protein
MSGSGGGGGGQGGGGGGGGGQGGGPGSGQAGGGSAGLPPMMSTLEACERIKEEYNFLQAQNQSLKLEIEKIAQEKTEMQRHYVMYYEMSYGLNVEMHKQTEIAKRLSAICAQLVPYLSQEVVSKYTFIYSILSCASLGFVCGIRVLRSSRLVVVDSLFFVDWLSFNLAFLFLF